MANYNVTLRANGGGPDLLIWQGSNASGTSSGAAMALDAGDTVSFKKAGFGYSGSIVVSGFAGGMWTSTSNLTLTTSYQSKTVKSGGTVGFVDALTGTAGSKTQTRYFKIGGVEPDLTITDIEDISRENGSTNHAITIAEGTSTTEYDIRTSSYTGSVVGTRSGNGALTVSNIPSAGNSRDYYVTGRVTAANGGSNSASSILSYSVTHQSPGATTGDGGTGTYGIQVLASNGDIVLDVSDRVVVFADYVSGTLSTSETSKNVTLARAGTAVIDMEPITTPIISGVAQRHKILHTSVSGTTLTIQRTSTSSGGGSAQTAPYKFLVVFDPEA